MTNKKSILSTILCFLILFTIATVSIAGDIVRPKITEFYIAGKKINMGDTKTVYWLGSDNITGDFIKISATDNDPYVSANIGVTGIPASLVFSKKSSGNVIGHDYWAEKWVSDSNKYVDGSLAWFFIAKPNKHIVDKLKYNPSNATTFINGAKEYKYNTTEDETYFLTVSAVDYDTNKYDANLESSSSFKKIGPYIIRFDFTKPDAIIDTSTAFKSSTSPPKYYINKTDLSSGIKFTIDEKHGSGIEKIVVWVENNATGVKSKWWGGKYWHTSIQEIAIPVKSSSTKQTFTYLLGDLNKFSVGEYSIYVNVKDKAGNKSGDRFTFTIDNGLPKKAAPYVKPGTAVKNTIATAKNTTLKNDIWYNEVVLPDFIFVDGDDSPAAGGTGAGIKKYQFWYRYLPSLYPTPGLYGNYNMLTINYQDTKQNSLSKVVHYDATKKEYKLKFEDLCKNPSYTNADYIRITKAVNAKTFKKGEMHTISTVTFDNVNNETPENKFWTIKIDETAPEAFYLNEPFKNPIHLLSNVVFGGVTFDWTASKDKTSGVRYYDLDIKATGTTAPLPPSLKAIPIVVAGSGLPPLPPTFDTKKTLPPGTYRWSVTAYDRAGNSVKSKLPLSATWQYDQIKVGLDKAVSVSPANGYENAVNIMPAFTWKQDWVPPSISLPYEYTIKLADKSSGTVVHSEKIHAGFAHTLGKQSFTLAGVKYDFEGKISTKAGGGATGEIKWNLTGNTVFNPGDYEWWVETTDNLGNTYVQTTKRTIKLLAKASASASNPLPSTPGGKLTLTFLLSSPANKSVSSSKTVKFKWGTYKSLTSYDLYIDGKKTDTLTKGEITKTLDEGKHTWYVVAKDKNGNTYNNAGGTHTFDIDAGGPEIEITSGGNKITNNSTLPQGQDLKISIKDGNEVNAKTIKITIDGKTVTTQSSSPGASSKAVALTAKTTSLTEGTHTLKVEAEDSLKNKSTVSYSVKSYAGALRVLTTPMNYPNPFKPSTAGTTLRYVLSTNADIEIQIFDLAGRQVTKLTYASGAVGGSAGENEVTWDGKYHGGAVLGNGAYLYVITSGGKVLEKGEMAIYE